MSKLESSQIRILQIGTLNYNYLDLNNYLLSYIPKWRIDQTILNFSIYSSMKPFKSNTLISHHLFVSLINIHTGTIVAMHLA